MELVSIIIPAFNAENFIDAAIDSAISQTYPNIEIIVVDDGSRDSTAALSRGKLQRDFDRPWRVLQLGKNRGVNVARNVGWRAAKGAWIQYLDSDDFLSPTKIETQVAACDEVSPEIAAVYSSYQPVFVDGTRIISAAYLQSRNLDNEEPIVFMVGDSYFMHQTCLLRRSVLDKVGGFDERLRCYEEVELLVRIFHGGWRFRFVPTKEPSYLWRRYRNQPREGGSEVLYSVVEAGLSWVEVALKATQNQPLANFSLTANDQANLANSCTRWARSLYRLDRDAFRTFISKVRILDPKFNPTYPRYLSFLSRLIGYENAEATALLLRGPRRLLRSTFA